MHRLGDDPVPGLDHAPDVQDAREHLHDLDTRGLDMDYEPIDVYDAEGQLDPGAVRAEVHRLLRRLNVPPERIDLRVLPDELPWKFEAGTPPIVEAVGLGAAVDYLAAVGMENVRAHEETITAYMLEGLTVGEHDVIHERRRRRRSIDWSVAPYPRRTRAATLSPAASSAGSW